MHQLPGALYFKGESWIYQWIQEVFCPTLKPQAEICCIYVEEGLACNTPEYGVRVKWLKSLLINYPADINTWKVTELILPFLSVWKVAKAQLHHHCPEQPLRRVVPWLLGISTLVKLILDFDTQKQFRDVPDLSWSGVYMGAQGKHEPPPQEHGITFSDRVLENHL